MDLLNATLDLGSQIIAQGPRLGGAQAPPGSSAIEKVLTWVLWLVTAACIGGVLMAGGKMAIAGRQGGGAEHAQGLLWVLGGCILVGSASGITAALI